MKKAMPFDRPFASPIGKSLPIAQQKGPGGGTKPGVRPVRANAPVPVAQTKQGMIAPGLRTPAVVQRLVDVKQGQTRKDLIDAMLRIDGMQQPIKRLGLKALDKCFGVLEMSKQYHGRIDASNEQMAGLIYFQCVRVNKSFTDGSESRRQVREEFDHRLKTLEYRVDKLERTYQLAIVGFASAAAYYIDTLGVAYDHRFTILIGKEDPWAHRRGQGITYINHVDAQISYPSEGARDYSTKFIGRTDFAARTKRIIEDAIPAGNRFQGEVREVKREEVNGRARYTIRWQDGPRERIHYAHKVVVAAGAGPHSVPPNDVTALAKPGHKDRVMDMDKFIREVANTLNGTETVVVQGPNAAVDATAAAHLRNCRVYWFVRGTPPVYLPGTLYDLGRIPLYKAADKNFKIDIVPADQKLRVNATSVRRCTAPNHQRIDSKTLEENEDLWGAKENFSVQADFFVYGIGQNNRFVGDADFPAAPGSFLSNEIVKSLDFVHHTGGRYGMVGSPIENQPVGLRAKPMTPEQKKGFDDNRKIVDQGVFVIGGSAAAFSDEKMKTQLKGVNKFQSSDIVAYEQLGGIRSAMYGLNDILPPDIGERVDFSHADPTALRAHIAIKYPSIKETQATRIINMILQHRRTGHHPHGYDPWWKNHFEGMLRFWNDMGRR